MSIIAAVGRTIAIDKSTQVSSRPSTTRVKVILDLLDKHPGKVRLQYIDATTEKMIEEFQIIVYDNLHAYCCHCKHQVHEEVQCRLLKGKMQSAQVGDETVEAGDQAVRTLQGDVRDFLNSKKQQKLFLSKPTNVLGDGTFDRLAHK